MPQTADRQFNRLALGAVLAGFTLLIAAFVAGLFTVNSAQSASARVSHTYLVFNQLAEVEVWIERAETASRGYLLSPDPAREQTYRDNIAKIDPAIDRLAGLTRDNPQQRANIDRLRVQVADELASLRGTMGLAVAGQLSAARERFTGEVKVQRVNAIRATTARLRTEEQRLLVARSAQEHAATTASTTVLTIAGLFLILLTIGATTLVRRYTVDLSAARDRLNLLNTDLEGAVAVRTADLQRANDEIQRFAYIVSHDLRSPLVNVMGFTAELDTAHKQIAGLIDRVEAASPGLIDEQARLAAKEDLPEAVGFIRSSTQKMDRLINSILRLSREGRRTLTPEHLPMDKIVEDIAATFEQMLGSNNARILIQPPLPDLVSDRVAVEQILSNLIENAIKYGKTDTPGVIEVSGERTGKRVAISVTDNGRGIDPRDHQRIFDLFRRSGKQDKPGEGLGLAHVRALAYRLGGTIDVESKLGEGATFRLVLPATYMDQEASA